MPQQHFLGCQTSAGEALVDFDLIDCGKVRGKNGTQVAILAS
jgi:hypothetical protein